MGEGVMETEVAEYLRELENLCSISSSDDFERRKQAWISMRNIIDYVFRREYVFVPIGSLKTISIEIIGETEKAWKVKIVTAKVTRAVITWLPKSQVKLVGGGSGMFVKNWLLRKSFLEDAAVEFIATKMAEKYGDIADMLFREVLER